jgi:NhaP-type Na+/H+ or K+/H+ antiporter
MDNSFEIAQLMAITIAAGIGAQVLANYLRLPSIVCLLGFGILLGRDALNILHPELLGIGLEVLVSLAVALILFEGGLNLELRDVGKVSGSLRNLVTIGTMISLLGGGIAARWLAEFPWPIAFLYSSLVVVTGPTVIGPLLKNVRVERQVGALLESEGVLIDPVGAILAVVVLDIVVSGNADPLTVAVNLGVRLAIGGGIGAAGGWLLGFFLKRAKFLSEDLTNLVVLAGMWGLYILSQSIISESGLMAAVAAGVVVRATGLPMERTLRRFKGQLTILAVSVLFVLLAADLSLASLVSLGWGGVGTVAVLMLAVRPLNVWACTWKSGLTWQQKVFAGWVGPKGIVSASVASLFAIVLTQNNVTGGDSIKALVFLTIILTVTVQGLTAGVVAKWLKLRSTEATGVLIVGSTPLSRLIGRLFQERGEAVAIVDTDPEACRAAEADNLRVFLSSALDAAVLEAAGLESMGTFLAMTSNGEVNAVAAQRAAEEFGPPRVLAIFPRDPEGSTVADGEAKGGAIAAAITQPFMEDVPLKTWNQYLSDRAVKLGETELRSATFAFQQAHLNALMRSRELVPILIEREERLMIAAAGGEWQPGDRIIYLLHDPKPKLLKRLAGTERQGPLVPEKLPAVEEVPMEPSSLAGAP